MKKYLLIACLTFACSVAVQASRVDKTSRMSSAYGDWTDGQKAWGEGGVERYNGNSTAFPVGNVLAQTITGLDNGFYEVEFYAFENFSNWDNNANIASGSNIAQAFANVSVEDIYVIKNTGGRAFDDSNKFTLLAQVTDGTLVYGIKNKKAGGNWAVCKPVSLTYLGTVVDDNTDLTSAINNYHFVNCANNDFPGWTISAPNGGNTWENGTSAVEYWSASSANGSFDYYQTINGLPNGLYTLSASMWNSTDNEENASFNGGNTSGVYGMSSNGEGFGGVTIDSDNGSMNTYTTGNVLVTDGTLRVGVKNRTTMTARWFGVDWIKLQYVGACISSVATALPENGSMAANTWYYIDIPVAGNNYKATATTLYNIVYTADATVLLTNQASVTGHFTATDNNLVVGRYYVKSLTAQTLSVEAASFSYTVGTASADLFYIQPGNTVTVTYGDAVTNSGEALTINTSAITFNGAALTNATTSTKSFTFDIPAGLNTATDYTLNIPAGAVGYTGGNTYNETQAITLHTVAVFDGTYYLRVTGSTTDLSSVNTSQGVTGKYLARGVSSGTHATFDSYGLAINVSTDRDNKTLLKVFDTQRYYFATGSWDLYADGTGGTYDNQKFIITRHNSGGLLIAAQATPNVYFKCNDSALESATGEVYFDGNGTNAGPILLWEAVSTADHAAEMNGRKDNQAKAAAAAAYAGDNATYASLQSVTTVAGIEAAVADMYNQVITGGDAPTTVTEKYQGGQPDSAPETVYSGTLTIPAQGLYKFSMQAFYRAGSNEITQQMHEANADFPPVVLFLGNAETQIKSLYDEAGVAESIINKSASPAPFEYNGGWYANDTKNSLIVFKQDLYHNDVWAYFPEAGTYTYGVKYMGWANDNRQWFIYSPEAVTVTYYGSDNSRFDRLAGEIKKAKAINSLYNNDDLATAIAAAETMYTAYTANLTAVNAQIAALQAQYPTTKVTVKNGTFDANPIFLADGTTSSKESRFSTNALVYDLDDYTFVSTSTEWFFGANAEYGSPVLLNSKAAPAKDMFGSTSGATLGLSAGWGNYLEYTQNVTVASEGKYLVYYEAYNRNTETVIGANKVGLDGTYSPKVDGFTTDEWVTDAFVVNIYDAGTYPLSVGIQAVAGVGSGSTAKLWIDNVEVYRIGDSEGAIEVADGIVTVKGTNAVADINAALTADVSVLDLEKATGLSAYNVPTTQNPNLLIYTKSASQVSNSHNVIVGNSCSSLKLSKQNTSFFVPKAFTATSAVYTVASSDLAGGKFATLMIPFAAEIPAGKAYTLDQGVRVLGGELTATASTTEVRANAPVLITGSGNFTAATSVDIPVIAKGATFTNGELVGVYSTKIVPTGSYVLQNHTSSPNGVAFYLVADTQPGVGPFRAYIKTQPTAAKERVLTIQFSDQPTGIEERFVSDQPQTIYDLSGRKVTHAAKGLYIIGGKRVLVK